MAPRPWLSLICLASALIASCSQGERPPEQGERSDAPTLVDVGGHHLETLVIGQGKPAVVFEAGFIGGIHRMRSLQDRIAARTLTVAYERAGLGGSQPGTEPRSASRIADELHTLLDKLGISEPVILVGYSAGGMFGRVFAKRFSDRVAGLVLVDPATEDAYEYWRTTDRAHWTGFEQDVRQRYNPPAGWYGQWRALPQSMDEARAAWPLPEVPVTIFTALVPLPEEWVMANEARIQVWLNAHRDLVARIPGAKHVVVESADHVNILNHPDLMRTILEIVESVRKGR